MNTRMQECCMSCSATRATCIQTMQMCLKKGGKLADAKLSLMLSECAQLCQMAADMGAADSERFNAAAQACAQHCDNCAHACDAMNESVLDECSAVLRECAELCRSMRSAVAV
ncbi:MAG: hypothetical protein HKL90_02985 [Elusimicrobia bacterium]|nr:hypothetical protein [Elusimicrobiota bacterium]